MQLDLTGVDPKTAKRIMKGVEAAKRERVERAAPQLLSALEAFVEDVRVAYIGIQEPEMVDHSALMHEWPDLVRSFHVARAAIARSKGAQ